MLFVGVGFYEKKRIFFKKVFQIIQIFKFFFFFISSPSELFCNAYFKLFETPKHQQINLVSCLIRKVYFSFTA